MKLILTQLEKIPRAIWWGAGMLVVYAVLGFLLVPWLAERQFRNLLQQRLSLSMAVERLSFNPFAMRAEVQGLAVTGPDGASLLRLGNLVANLQASRLLLLKLQLAELAVSDMDLYLSRTSDGTHTIAMLAQSWAASSELVPEPSLEIKEPSAPFPIEVVMARLYGLDFHLRDETPAVPFETTVTLASAELANLSTLPDSAGSNRFLVELEQGARLDWVGTLQLNPPLFNGRLSLTDLGLSAVSRYLQESIPVAVADGRFGASLEYRIDLGGESAAIDLGDIDLTVRDLAVKRHGFTEPFLATPLLQLNGGSLQMPANQVSVEAVNVGRLQLAVERGNDGRIDLQQILAGFQPNPRSPDPAVSASTPQGRTAWTIDLQQLILAESRISFVDQSPAEPATLALIFDAALENLDNQPGSSFPLTAGLRLETGGDVDISGTVEVLPATKLSAEVSVSGLDLTILQPYLSEFSHIALNSGQLSLDGEIGSDSYETLSFLGNLQLQDVNASDQLLQERLLGAGKLEVRRIDFGLSRNVLDISEVVVDSPFARVVVNQDGSTNLSNAFKSPESESESESESSNEASPPDAVPAAEGPMAITVGRLQITNGASNFTDNNLPIVFHAGIHELNGSAEGFSTASAQPMELVLEGNVDEFGLLQLSGTAHPFDFTRQSDVDLRFRNLQLAATTPYAIKYAGREIVDGRLDVDLEYIIDGGELIASNRAVMHDLQLGQQIEQEGAMDLPLDLAVALLKDGNGIIDLEVPITGNLADPQFDFGPAIRRAITNALTSIVAAPFRLLGRLIGGDDNDLGSIRFQPGRSDLAPPEQQVLQQLYQAFLQRPELVLEVPLLSGEADRQALQAGAVNARIEGLLASSAGEPASLTDRRLAALEALYTEAALVPTLAETRLDNTPAAAASDVASSVPATVPTLDVPAYVEVLRRRLVEAQPVTALDLETLARARADAVAAYLQGLGEFDPKRVQVTDLRNEEPDEDGWLTLEFGLRSGRP